MNMLFVTKKSLSMILKGKSILFMLILLLLLGFKIPLFSQANQYKNKLRHGKWITYHDDAKLKPASKGKYKSGMQKGKWQFYDEEGNCIKRENYKKRKIKVRLFYPGDKIWKKGLAKLELTDSLYRYYFTGEWKCYNRKGELEKLEYYEKGHMIKDVLFKTSELPSFNDSLAKQIKVLYNLYYQYADSVNYVKRNYGAQTYQYKRMMKLEFANDSLIKLGIESITSKFGYPPKEMVGEEYVTLFFLISSYDLSIKEKYYDLIVSASDNGVLSKRDVSFFIDKVKVGRKEPQIYGTQFRWKNDNPVYYPIEAPEKLNERRRVVGLDELELLDLKFEGY